MRRDWHSVSETAKEEALAWHVRLTADDVSDEDYAAFGEWAASDADNVAATEWVESIDERIKAAYSERMETPISSQWLAPSKEAVRVIPNWGYAALAASLALFFVFGALNVSGVFSPNHFEKYASTEGPLNVALEDGTNIVLAPGSQMNVNIGRRHRGIADFKGVGYFHVARDKARPFTISLDGSVITVVGTQFEVKSFLEKQTVSVVDGVVQVSEQTTTDKQEAPITLVAGKSVTINRTNSAKPVVSNVKVSDIAPWRKGALEFFNEPLPKVLDTLNELYGSETFVYKTNGDSSLIFNGVLQVTGPALVSRRLEELLPIKIDNVDGKFLVKEDDRSESGRN